MGIYAAIAALHAGFFVCHAPNAFPLVLLVYENLYRTMLSEWKFIYYLNENFSRAFLAVINMPVIRFAF
jgi:hypothetical protein